MLNRLPAPVLEEGLFMLVTDRLLIVRMDDRLTSNAFERYKAEWLLGVDRRSETSRVGAFYDMPDGGGFNAKQRREVGIMLKSREEILRRTTVGMVLVTSSLLLRGALRAVYWLAPPPFPYAICDTVRDGWTYLSERLAGLDPELAVRAYRSLVQEYVPSRMASRPPRPMA